MLSFFLLSTDRLFQRLYRPIRLPLHRRCCGFLRHYRHQNPGPIHTNSRHPGASFANCRTNRLLHAAADRSRFAGAEPVQCPVTVDGPPSPPSWPESYVFSTDPDRIVCRKCCKRHYSTIIGGITIAFCVI
jgi:hypothetical protein